MLEHFRQQVRSVLRDNMFERKIPSTRGKLNMNRLHAHHTSKKLFYQKNESKKKYNFEILLDASGSIFNRDEEHNIARLGTALKELLHGNCNQAHITAFNYLEKRIPLVAYEEDWYLDKVTNDDTLYKTETLNGMNSIVEYPKHEMTSSSRQEDGVATAYGGNYESILIAKAAQRLKAMDGQGIIIVVLDGNQNLDNHEGAYENLVIYGERIANYKKSDYKNIVDGIENKLHIPVIGIGVGVDLGNIFKHGATVQDGKDTYQAIVESLKQIIK